MALDKGTKEAVIANLTQVFSQSKIGFLVDYRGMTMEEVTDLRRKLYDASSNIKVLKNRLAKRAVKNTPFEPLADQFTDTRAFIYGSDPLAPAKVVDKFLSSQEKVKLIAAFMVKDTGGSLLDKAQVKALANLPSRDELIVQLLFLMQSPATNLVRTLNEVPAKFVRTLAAVAEAKSKAS